MLDDAPTDIRALVSALAAKVVRLCQPSEALDVGWSREWRTVLDEVARLRAWVARDEADRVLA
jgi:hypothetical protein